MLTLPRRTRRPILLGGIAVVLVVLAAILGTVFAITGGGADCLGTGGSGSGGSGGAGPAPTQLAEATFSPQRLMTYEEAGARFDVNWAFLASISEQECASATCSGNNSSGCAGPMQIADVPDSPCSPGNGPTLWQRYKVSATGGVPNINNFPDAVFTAARIFHEAKDAPPINGSYSGYYQAACNYYGACASYAPTVMARAVSYGFDGPGTPPGLTKGAGSTGTVPASDGGDSCPGLDTTGGYGGGGGPVSGDRIVRIAESQIGVKENPWGSNCQKYGPCEEWCALFVAWVWEHAGVPMRGGTSPYAYSGTIFTWAKTHGGRDLAPTARPSPGDAVFYGTGPNNSVHTGIVERVFPDGEIVTIEGNDDNQVLRNGPFQPSQAVQSGEPAAIYGYAQPPGPKSSTGQVTSSRRGDARA